MPADHRKSEATGLRRLFQEQWDHLTQLIDQYQTQQREKQQQKVIESENIELVVEGTSGKMRMVASYQKQLRGSVRILLNYVENLVKQLPPPIHVSMKHINTDPQLNAFFVNQADISDTFGRCDELRKLFAAPHNNQLTQAYAILFLVKKEKTVLGMELREDIIVRDVKQTVIRFTNHNIEEPCASEEELKTVLKSLLFNSFVSYVKYYLLRLSHAESERADDADNHPIDESRESSLNLKNPEIYFRELCKILENPQDLLRLEQNTICVTRMGIKTLSGVNNRVNEVCLHEIMMGKTAKEIICLVSFPRDEMPPKKDLLKEASAILGPI